MESPPPPSSSPPSPHRPPPPPPPLEPPARRLLTLEVLAVLALGPLPQILREVVEVTHRSSPGEADAAYGATGGLAYAAGLILLVIVLGLRSGEPAESLGLVRPRWADLLLVVGLSAGAMMAWWVCMHAIDVLLPDLALGKGLRRPFRPMVILEYVEAGAEWVLVDASLLAVSVAYLVPRLLRLGLRPASAVASAALLLGATGFSSGTWHAVHLFVSGVFASVTFLQFRRVTPIIGFGAYTGLAALVRTITMR